MSPSLTVITRATPTLNSHTPEWRRWISFVTARAVLKRKELHGCWRALAREKMLGAIKGRSDAYALGAQRSAISSWLTRAKRAPPMRSILTVDSDGDACMTAEPILLKLTVDTAFKLRAGGGHGPLKWVHQTKHNSPCAEGHAIRLALADKGIVGMDLTGVPPFLHYVLDGAQRKFINKTGRFASPLPYMKRGCMSPRTPSQFTEYFASRRKGTAPRQSQLSVSLIWALQLRVRHTKLVSKKHAALSAKKPVAPAAGGPVVAKPAAPLVGAPATVKRAIPATDVAALKAKAKKLAAVPTECLTAHVFDSLRVLTNLILVTALVPAGMLRNILCLVDKVAGSHAMSNKRPLGMVEQLAQATVGPQFRIIEDTWEADEMIDKYQAGGSRGTGCDVPVMLVTTKMEHAWIYKHTLHLVLQDQSKAFETLLQYLGQEVPLRRLGVPEPALALFNAFKTGSWFMVATAWGPRQIDWDLTEGKLHECVNVLQYVPP
jgi:hypothetical protein